jgi:hypothetical protein
MVKGHLSLMTRSLNLTVHCLSVYDKGCNLYGYNSGKNMYLFVQNLVQNIIKYLDDLILSMKDCFSNIYMSMYNILRDTGSTINKKNPDCDIFMCYGSCLFWLLNFILI